ncbi:putative methyltransferase-domain-containing protein [Boeremia exigua]|uniref:putative methyltransferase-domain-containing protein n=1 Tax=Boeremia exigua TaxID=749465 RepID=UPI001E8CF19E|nr:putative methyltransferase-domain-containing protein [Boeremia exigua]KAH6612633.1 putative methyltransferase-domain-containing protein [Boeremia exigua]
MRYIRFLKTPRIAADKRTGKPHATCLIALTSDLGDSTLPYDTPLVADLLSARDEVVASRTALWPAGARTLAISLPLKPAFPAVLRLRISTAPAAAHDTFAALCAAAPAVLSAWSAEFSRAPAPPLVQRRLRIAHRTVSVWEETGDSIARHLWDAGIALASAVGGLATAADPATATSTSPSTTTDPAPIHPPDLASALNLPPSALASGLTAVELGTGTGLVGLTLASLLPHAHVVLTDLPAARSIVATNIAVENAVLAEGARVRFEEWDWDGAVPGWVGEMSEVSERSDVSEVSATSETSETSSAKAASSTTTRAQKRETENEPENRAHPNAKKRIDLALVADCTYNPDSSPALVRTLSRLAALNPRLAVVVALKTRHASEAVFYELMADARFEEAARRVWELPGDEGVGGERVEVFVYRWAGAGEAVGHEREGG